MTVSDATTETDGFKVGTAAATKKLRVSTLELIKLQQQEKV